MLWVLGAGCQSLQGQMPIPCPPTPFVSNSSIWKDPGVNNGLSLPSDLIGTVCPSLAEAAGGLGWWSALWDTRSFCSPITLCLSSFQGKKPSWQPAWP